METEKPLPSLLKISPAAIEAPLDATKVEPVHRVQSKKLTGNSSAVPSTDGQIQLRRLYGVVE